MFHAPGSQTPRRHDSEVDHVARYEGPRPAGRCGLRPAGDLVFASLRGPNPLTADPHVSTGLTPGVGVFEVYAGGRDGRFVSLAPVTNVDATGVERADVHAIAVRALGR